jgi:transcription-repair coupling factor (superfamily II helicase)
VHLRLSFCKKLASAKNTGQIDALLEEIVDRFGKLPAQQPVGLKESKRKFG